MVKKNILTYGLCVLALGATFAVGCNSSSAPSDGKKADLITENVPDDPMSPKQDRSQDQTQSQDQKQSQDQTQTQKPTQK